MADETYSRIGTRPLADSSFWSKRKNTGLTEPSAFSLCERYTEHSWTNRQIVQCSSQRQIFRQMLEPFKKGTVGDLNSRTTQIWSNGSKTTRNLRVLEN